MELLALGIETSNFATRISAIFPSVTEHLEFRIVFCYYKYDAFLHIMHNQ